MLTEFVENYHEHLHDFMDAMAATNDRNWYNIPPSSILEIRCNEAGSNFIQSAKWGLIPHWSTDGRGQSLARAETIHEKPTFKRAFERRRCVVLATGYYEWKMIGNVNQPFYFRFPDNRPFFLYGIWQTWSSKSTQQQVTSFAIITTDPADYIAPIADRMPCVVDIDSPDVTRWLDHSDDDFQSKHQLLQQYDADEFSITPVSTYVNNARHQGPQCIKPVDLPSQLFE